MHALFYPNLSINVGVLRKSIEKYIFGEKKIYKEGKKWNEFGFKPVLLYMSLWLNKNQTTKLDILPSTSTFRVVSLHR